MISGKADILSWFKDSNKKYFALFKQGEEKSGNAIFTNTDKIDQTFEFALHDFEKCLALLSTGQFFIYAYDDDKNQSKGRRQTYFTISLSDKAPTATQPAIAGNNTGYDYETVLAKAGEIATEKFERLMEKERLRVATEKLAATEKELKEIKAEQDSRWNKLIDTASPFIPQIISGIFPQGAAIGNIPAPDNHIQDNSTIAANSEAIEEQMQASAQAFCEALAARYPVKETPEPGYLNWVQVLQKLTTVLQTDPNKIDFALKYL